MVSGWKCPRCGNGLVVIGYRRTWRRGGPRRSIGANIADGRQARPRSRWSCGGSGASAGAPRRRRSKTIRVIARHGRDHERHHLRGIQIAACPGSASDRRRWRRSAPVDPGCPRDARGGTPSATARSVSRSQVLSGSVVVWPEGMPALKPGPVAESSAAASRRGAC